MALPTGSGSEILKSGGFFTMSNSATSLKFDGNPTAGTNTDVVPALSIVTILNISYCEQGGAAELLDLWVRKSGASDDVYILNDGSLPAKATFVYSDRIVLMAGDKISTQCDGSTGNVDVFYSYIIQDWT